MTPGKPWPSCSHKPPGRGFRPSARQTIMKRISSTKAVARIYSIPARYFADLGAVQSARKAGEPRLLPGVELGYLPHLDSHFAALTAAWPFNSVILSLHILEGEDPFVNVDMYRSGKTDVYGRYLRQLAGMVRNCPDFDIVGHFDYISRYAPFADRKMHYNEFQADFDNLFRTLIVCGKTLEINTRTIVKLRACGYSDSESFPDRAIFQRYLELGGQLVSLGSDAHKADEAGFLFPETMAWLREIGFRQIVHYEMRKAVFSEI